MVDIFEYLDYRLYLSDYYKEKKAENANFSYRYIAGKVGFKSAGLFTKILQGKRNMSVKLTLRFAEAFKLKKKELEYFELLVLFNQAKTSSEKNHYYERLLAFKKSKVSIIDANRYEFYDKWYYTVVRELLSYTKFTNDYKELARMVVPPISAAEAKRSVELLEELGFIRKNDLGWYERTESVISTGYEARSLAINNFIVGSINLASEAVDRFPKDQRNISALTLSISGGSFNKIQDELRTFRRKLMEIAESDSVPDRVYQINFQVFPVSKFMEGKAQ